MNLVILLDTNVVVDLLLERKDYELARAIIQTAINDESIECVTATTVTDIIYLVSKYHIPKLDSYKVQDRIMNLLKIIDVLPVTRTDIECALGLRWKDAEDALQYYVAKTNGCDCIITNNVKDFESDEIEVITPKDFIEKYKDEFPSLKG